MFQIIVVCTATGSVLISITLCSLAIAKRWQRKLERTQRIIKYLEQNEAINHLNRNHALETNLTATIGDPRCLYNARSAYLRCAVNPNSSCDSCPHFEERLEV